MLNSELNGLWHIFIWGGAVLIVINLDYEGFLLCFLIILIAAFGSTRKAACKPRNNEMIFNWNGHPMKGIAVNKSHEF